jgi:uncharacterized protein
MVYEFRWNAWNVDHIAEHGVTPDEAEYVVRNARAPYPRKVGERKYLVQGQTPSGDYIQVIFFIDSLRLLFVIHARPLRDLEKRRFRRRRQT